MAKRFFPGILAAVLLLVGCASTDMLHVNRGYEAINGGRLVEAEQHLASALEVNPDNPYTLLNLGYVYQHTGRYDAAREMYRGVIALDSGDRPSKVSVDSLKGLSVVELAQRNLAMLPAEDTALEPRVAGR